jgi:hypothetical protein
MLRLEMPYNGEGIQAMANAMRNFKTRGSLDRSASEDLFRHTLARIPSLYGRLMYLSALRDPNTGTYRHYGLAAAFGRDQSIKALESSHKRTFRDWLRLSLQEKHEDLLGYLQTLDDPKGLVVNYWIESEGYLGCVPDAASKADRSLYSSDVRQILHLVKYSSGGAPPDPKASR